MGVGDVGVAVSDVLWRSSAYSISVGTDGENEVGLFVFYLRENCGFVPGYLRMIDIALTIHPPKAVGLPPLLRLSDQAVSTVSENRPIPYTLLFSWPRTSITRLCALWSSVPKYPPEIRKINNTNQSCCPSWTSPPLSGCNPASIGVHERWFLQVGFGQRARLAADLPIMSPAVRGSTWIQALLVPFPPELHHPG